MKLDPIPIHSLNESMFFEKSDSSVNGQLN
jgi:hypothetical protein